MLKLPEVC
jgi:hypothetical protein